MAAVAARIPGLAETAAPRVTIDHDVACTRCATPVPYASMSLNEHGYFCSACAASMH